LTRTNRALIKSSALYRKGCHLGCNRTVKWVHTFILHWYVIWPVTWRCCQPLLLTRARCIFLTMAEDVPCISQNTTQRERSLSASLRHLSILIGSNQIKSNRIKSNQIKFYLSHTHG
jgi:hypothetical protein